MAEELISAAVLAFDVDGTEAVAGLAQIEQATERTERAIATKAGRMGEHLAGIGTGASRGAADVDRATKQTQASIDRATRQAQSSIERMIATLQAGSKDSVGYFENLFKGRGANLDQLRPLLDQFGKLKSVQEEVAEAAREAAEKQRLEAAALFDSQRALAQSNATREAHLNKLREEIKLLQLSEAEQRAYRAAQANQLAGGGTEGTALLADIERTRLALERLNQTRREAAALKSSNDGFITSLQRESEAIGKTRIQLLEMDAARRGLSTQAAPYIAKLREMEKGHNGLTISAGQSAAAMRQLPAQMTDVVTQLAGGQSPFLILLQQGGQVKDSFGGIGNAAKAIIGAINPLALSLGVAAASIAAVSYAAFTGSSEQIELRRQLGLTGQGAGLTETSFGALAQTVAGKSRSSFGEAREVLLGLAKDGKLSADAMESTATAALLLSRVTGESADKIAGQLVTSLKDASKGAYELNQQYSFLTTSEYRHIAALQEQGDMQKAVTTTMDALAGKVAVTTQNLGFLEKAWAGAKVFFGEFVEQYKNIGKELTTAQQIKALENQIAATKAGNFDRSELPGLERQLEMLKKTLFLENERTAATARNVLANQASIEFLRAGEQYLDKQAKKAQEIATARRQAAASQNADNPADRVTDSQLAARLDEINKKYAEKAKVTKSSADAFLAERDAAKVWMKTIEEAEKLTDDATNSTDGLTKAQAALLGYLKSPAYAINSDAMREMAVNYLIGAHNAEVLQIEQKKLNSIIHDSAAAYTRFIDSFKKQADTAEEAVRSAEDETKALELSERSHISLAEAIARVAIERLRERQIAAMGNPDVVAELQREIDAREKLLGLIRSKEARAANLSEAKAQADLWSRTNDRIGAGLAEALKKGGREAGDYIENLFDEMVLTPILKVLISPATGALTTALVGAASGGNGSDGNVLGNALNGASTASTLYNAYQGGGITGSALAAGNYASVYSGAAYGTGFGTQQSAMLAAQESGMVSGAGASSMAAWAGYAAAVIAAWMASKSAWDKGFNNDNLTGAFKWSPESTFTDLLKLGGLSDRAANIWGGGSVYSSVFGRADPRIESQGVMGTLGGGDFAGQLYADIVERGGLFRSTKRYTDTAQITEPLENLLDISAKAVLSKAKEYGAALGLPAEQLDSISTDIKVALGADAEANKAEITKALALYGTALVEGFKDQVAPLALYGESVSDTIGRVGAALLGVNNILKSAGLQQLDKSVTGAGSALSLADRFGGADTLSTTVSSFYQAFTPEAERAKRLTADLSTAFGDLGLTMPSLTDGVDAAHAGYVALIKAQDLNTEAGQNNFLGLLKMAGAYDTVAQLAEKTAKKITDTQGGLQLELLQAQGKGLEALTLQRTQELATLQQLERETGVAAGTFTSLKQAVYGATDAAIASSKRSDLEIQYLRATGQESAAVNRERELELATLRDLERTTGTATGAFTSMQQAIYDATDAVAELARQQSLASGIDSVVGNFLKGPELSTYFGNRILQILGKVGINGTLEGVFGSTKDDILKLFKAVGTDGKEAILEALPFWNQLKDSLLQTAGVAGSVSELLAAFDEINPAADTLVTSWRKNRDEMKYLQDALDELFEAKPRTREGMLQALVGQANSFKSLIDNNLGTIENAIIGRGDQSSVDYLRQSEAVLSAEFKATNDPHLAQLWTETLVKRIQIEGQLRQKALQDQYDAEYEAALETYNVAKETDTLLTRQQRAQRDSLQEQIDGWQKMRDLAKELPEILGNIRAGDLSIFSVEGRLRERQSLFERSLQTGNDPAGALQSLLQQAQGVYGNTSQYGVIYNQAMAQFEAKVKQGALDADVMLPNAVRTLMGINKIADQAMPKLQQAVVDSSGEIVTAVKGLNTIFNTSLTGITNTLTGFLTATQIKDTTLTDLLTQWTAPFLTALTSGGGDENGYGGGEGGGGGMLKVDWSPVNEGLADSLDLTFTTHTATLEAPLLEVVGQLKTIASKVGDIDERLALIGGVATGARSEAAEANTKAQQALDTIARNSGRVRQGSTV